MAQVRNSKGRFTKRARSSNGRSRNARGRFSKKARRGSRRANRK